MVGGRAPVAEFAAGMSRLDVQWPFPSGSTAHALRAICPPAVECGHPTVRVVLEAESPQDVSLARLPLLPETPAETFWFDLLALKFVSPALGVIRALLSWAPPPPAKLQASSKENE